MRYVYTEGKYREFRGYVFWNGKPVTILDRGTLEEIQRDKSFKLVDEKAEEASQPAAAQVTDNACPKCGKVIGKGRYFHVKYCKGQE